MAGRRFTIALDAMGGDFAPPETTRGAVEFSQGSESDLLLVGHEKLLQPELAKWASLNHRVKIFHAEEMVPMGAPSSAALRRNPHTSIAVAVSAVSEGRADAVVSAGHTVAIIATAMTTLRNIPGVERPAIMTLFPTPKGQVAMVDAGANVDCRPHHLLDFARMGSAYMEEVLGEPNPRIGLISIGSEAKKGNELTRAAFELLSQSGLNFVGNVEGEEVFVGECKVLVCDGFVGNVILKVCEGFGQFVLDCIKERWERRGEGLEATIWERSLQSVGQILDYAEYGGALLLGVNGICVICHGRSNFKAIANAIRLAERTLEHNALGKIRAAVCGRE